MDPWDTHSFQNPPIVFAIGAPPALNMTTTTIQCAGRELKLDSPVIMGILNITPDSFSDGGLYNNLEQALQRSEKMIADGALIIDVGGESTRPGAQPVTEAQELDRVIPVIEKLHQEIDVIISVDTNKAVVITEAAKAGAGLINDVMALRNDGALSAAHKTGLPVCLMHIQGEPRNMQKEPQYNDVITEVKDFLQQQAERCIAQGINKEQIIIDPGFGFGKTLAHNISLFKNIKTLKALGYPVLVGASRKTMIGQITGKKEVSHRMAGSLAFAVMAAASGSAIIRAHDVAETVDAVKVAMALQQEDK